MALIDAAESTACNSETHELLQQAVLATAVCIICHPWLCHIHAALGRLLPVHMICVIPLNPFYPPLPQRVTVPLGSHVPVALTAALSLVARSFPGPRLALRAFRLSVAFMQGAAWTYGPCPDWLPALFQQQVALLQSLNGAPPRMAASARSAVAKLLRTVGGGAGEGEGLRTMVTLLRDMVVAHDGRSATHCTVAAGAVLDFVTRPGKCCA